MDLQSHCRNRGDTDNIIHRDRRKSRKGSMVMADRYRISMKEMNKSESERLNLEIYYERHKIFFFFSSGERAGAIRLYQVRMIR